MVLKEGVWMAIGPTQNIIINAVGEAPFIKIIKGISMNDFFNSAKVKELEENSMEIQHILQNPDQYTFESLTVSEAVYNLVGVGTRTFEKCDRVSDEDIKDLVRNYKYHLERFGADNDTMFIINLCKKFRITTGQASNILENKIKRALVYQNL